LRPRSAVAGFRDGADPRVDASLLVTADLPNGARAVLDANMLAPGDMSIVATGTRGTATVPNFVAVDTDDRLILTVDGVETTEHHGTTSTYTHQLQALIAAVRDGAGFPTDADNAIANMEIVDECYRLAGLPVRASAL
ncbi:MAG: gfo/Idh/MocA family oxidoreductase, partial [Propionicimonas sp.]